MAYVEGQMRGGTAAHNPKELRARLNAALESDSMGEPLEVDDEPMPLPKPTAPLGSNSGSWMGAVLLVLAVLIGFGLGWVSRHG